MAQGRRSNFELLRIISTIMIIVYHFAFWSAFDYIELEKYPVNYLFLNFLELFGKVGVDIFILISGYFLIEKDDIKVSKVIKLWLQIFFYSLLSYILFSLNIFKSDYFENSIPLFIERVMPISHGNWWFASSYFIIFLFSPFLNRFFKSLSNKQYLIFLALAVTCGSIIVTLTQKNEFQGIRLIPFFIIYSIGGYIKLHLNEIHFSRKKLGVILFVAIVVGLIVLLLWRREAKTDTFIKGYFLVMVGSETFPITMIISIVLFLIFKETEIGVKKPVNIVASASFAVYMIHTDILFKQTLWRTIIHGSDFQYGKLLIPYTIAACLGVYAACTVIELARIYLLEKNYMKLVYKAEPKINRALHRLADSVYEKIR